MKKLSLLVAVCCASLLVTAGMAQADPLMPPLGGLTTSVAGQSTLAGSGGAAGTSTYLDWIVYAPGQWSWNSSTWTVSSSNNPDPSTEYLYTYQLENPTLNNIELLTINVPQDALSTYGWVAGQDLDGGTWNHNSSTYSNLATETEGVTQGDEVVLASYDPTDINPNISWFFYLEYPDPLNPGQKIVVGDRLTNGEETEVLYFTSVKEPTYSVECYAQNGGQYSGPSPVPTPEPGTLLLLGSIVGGFAATKKRKTQLA